MPKPIPRGWCDSVVRILRSNDHRLIEWTHPAMQRWESDTFGNAFVTDAYEAMIKALASAGIEGNETTSHPGQAATHEFFFFYNDRRMYGKIALKNDRLRILILSAHTAERNHL